MLVGFLLLAPPLYVLGPLGLLLLLSRPRTVREWFWIATAVLASWLWLRGGDGLAAETVRASGVLLSGAFATLALAWRGETLTRSLVAVGIATVALAAWLQVLGVGHDEVSLAFEADFRERYQLMLDGARQDPGISVWWREALEEGLKRSATISGLYPGFLALLGVAGTSIAWRWYHRIAAAPAAPTPPAFRAFRFNDHLIWGAIFTLALVLVPVPAVPPRLVHNLLLVWVGLYAARGTAVAASVFAPISPLLKALGVLLALLLAPFSFGALLGMGLADTWLDIRGRMAAASASGGTR